MSRVQGVNDIQSDGDESQPVPSRSNPNDNPLEMLARMLKIDGLVVTIPAVPQIGLKSPTRVGMIYLMSVGVLYMIFDYKALIFAGVMFIIYKNSNHEG